MLYGFETLLVRTSIHVLFLSFVWLGPNNGGACACEYLSHLSRLCTACAQ
jgi:hypothetical protein